MISGIIFCVASGLIWLGDWVGFGRAGVGSGVMGGFDRFFRMSNEVRDSGVDWLGGWVDP